MASFERKQPVSKRNRGESSALTIVPPSKREQPIRKMTVKGSGTMAGVSPTQRNALKLFAVSQIETPNIAISPAPSKEKSLSL